MTRRSILILGCLAFLPLCSLAGDDAGVESPFSLGVGSRALGMGGGFTAMGNDASTVFYNPAGLARVHYNEISLMYVSLFEETGYSTGLWSLPLSRRTGVGFGFMRIGTDEIIKREGGFTVGEFDYSQSQAMLGFGWQSPWRVSFGATLKAVNQSLDDFSDWALAADLGAVADIGEYISVGVMARDLIEPELRLNNASEIIPRSFVWGAALDRFRPVDRIALSAAVDVEKFENRSLQLHAGGEVTINDRYSVRAGYDRDNFAAGLGLHVGALKIDYAFKVLDYVDDSHRFTVSFTLGKSRSERFADRIEAVTPPPRPLTEEEKRRLALRDTADQYFRALQLDSALVYFEKLLELDPENSEVAATITSIEADLAERERQRLQLELAEQELGQFTDRYLSQAVQFKEKEYYRAALDLLELVLEIAPEKDTAQNVKQEIERLIAREIQAHLDSAGAAQAAGRTVDAIGHYSRILELDPDNQSGRQMLEDARSGLNRTQRLQLAIELFESGRLRQARQRFAAILSDDPDNATARGYLDRIEAQLSDVTTLDDLQRNPRIWQAYISGIRLMRNREYQQAIEAFEEVLKAYPNNVDTQNNLEQARLRLQSEQSD
jgi:tetratricopeptide (TPR) repeat protein